jgi:peptidoglycan hydrolase CwlO-like protein
VPRLALFLCLVALLGSAVSAALYFQIGNSKQVLELRLADANTRATKLDADLARVNEETGRLKAKVASVSGELQQARSEIAAAGTRAAKLELDLTAVRFDLSSTQSVVSLYERTAQGLAEEISRLKQDLADTRASLATPEAVAAYKSTIAELERQLATARNGVALPATAGASTAAFSSRAAGRATILSVGPDNAFVVLNFGAARGAEVGHRLTVSHGTNEVAVVHISDVRPNFSVAQVLPDTLRGVLQTGDLAVLIR